MRARGLVLAVSAGLLLASCIRVEKARLQFAANGAGDLSIRTLIADEIFDDEAARQRVVKGFEDCGFAASLVHRGKKYVLETYAKFEGTDLDRFFQCLPFDWTRREVRLTTDTSLLYKKYRTLVLLEQPIAIRPSESNLRALFDTEPVDDDSYVPNELLFPLNLSVTAPGRVVEIIDRSTVVGGKARHSFIDNVATVDLTLPRDGDERSERLENMVARLARQSDPKPPLERYEFEIRSREARFDLTTMTTLAVIVFGSGLLAPLVAWIRRRRGTPDAADGEPRRKPGKRTRPR